MDGRIRRYPSDTTDVQWAAIDRLLPDPAWLGGKGGRREVHCRRTIVDAIFYVVDNGIEWRALPVDFPPWSTVYNYFAAWEAAGVTQDVLDALRTGPAGRGTGSRTVGGDHRLPVGQGRRDRGPVQPQLRRR